MASWGQIARRIRVPLGFVFAAAYLYLAKPSMPVLLYSLALVVPGLLLRAVASGHLQKNEQLAMAGPYAYTRNPLYLGSLIMALGFTLASRSLWIALIVAVLFVAIYFPVIRGEEAYLSEHFPGFNDYARRVPRLLPRLRFPGNNEWPFSWNLYCKHREYNATMGSAAIYGALVVKLLYLSR